jgi:hypothetical protein
MALHPTACEFISSTLKLNAFDIAEQNRFFCMGTLSHKSMASSMRWAGVSRVNTSDFQSVVRSIMSLLAGADLA